MTAQPGGYSPPQELAEFVGDEAMLRALPGAFHLHDGHVVIELQYLIDVSNVSSLRCDGTLVAFAVTTDGNELLVDAHGSSTDVFQDEMGDVDSLGVSIGDLASARYVSL